MTRFVFRLSAILALFAPASSKAAEVQDIEKAVRPFLQKHCVECHDAETQKGDFRLDTLSPKVGFEITPQWIEINPPHFPTPIPGLTVHGAAGAKANS